MIDLQFRVMEDWERKAYKTQLEQLHKKMAEKERKRPVGMKKKDWKKRHE